MTSILLSLLLFGQDISVQPEYKAKVGEFVIINPQTKATDIKFINLSNAGINILDSDLLKNKNQLIVSGSKNGKYKILIIGVVDNKITNPVYTEIIITDEVPVMDLAAALKLAYKGDSSATKAKSKEVMVNGFKAILGGLEGIKTLSDLNAAIQSNISSKLVKDELRTIRNLLKAELSDKFGDEPEKELNGDLARQILNNVVSALEGCDK
jgi:hypothetical protein